MRGGAEIAVDIQLGDVVKMRKPHPCGSDTWTVIRVGADIKIRCSGCARVVMLGRPDFEKRVKKILSRESPGKPSSAEDSSGAES